MLTVAENTSASHVSFETLREVAGRCFYDLNSSIGTAATAEELFGQLHLARVIATERYELAQQLKTLARTERPDKMNECLARSDRTRGRIHSLLPLLATASSLTVA